MGSRSYGERSGVRRASKQPTPAPAARGGQPLPVNVRSPMERSLGHDFSQVRIHKSARPTGLGARAFTEGDDIHFAPGVFQPNTLRGRRTIGHELAHVVQQRTGRVAATDPDPELEEQADRVGVRAASGQVAHEMVVGALPTTQAPTSSVPLQCERDEKTKAELKELKAQRDELHAWFVDQKRSGGHKTRREQSPALNWRWRYNRDQQSVIGNKIVALRQANPKLTSAASGYKGELGRGAISTVHQVTYGSGGAAQDKAFKPGLDASKAAAISTRVKYAGITEGDLSLRRIAAYKMAKVMGANVVPKTEFAEATGAKGELLKGTAMDMKVNAKPPRAKTPDYSNPITNRAVADLETVDYVFGEVDRHSENYLVGPQGHVFGHDSEFGGGVNISSQAPQLPMFSDLYQMDQPGKFSPMSHVRPGVPKRVSGDIFDNITKGVIGNDKKRSGAFEEDASAELAGYLTPAELKARRKAIKHAKTKLTENTRVIRVGEWPFEKPGQGGYYY